MRDRPLVVASVSRRPVRWFLASVVQHPVSCTRCDGFVLALFGVQEALACVDLRLACAILTGAIEGDGPSTRPYSCRNGCGASFEWPGLRDHHEAFCFSVAVAA